MSEVTQHLPAGSDCILPAQSNFTVEWPPQRERGRGREREGERVSESEREGKIAMTGIVDGHALRTAIIQ